MTTCTDPTELPSILRDRSKTHRTQDECDKAARKVLGVYNATLQLPRTTITDQNTGKSTPGAPDASNEAGPAPTSALRRVQLRLWKYFGLWFQTIEYQRFRAYRPTSLRDYTFEAQPQISS